MSVTIHGILDEVRAQGAATPAETLTYLGLLLERESMSRYGDPIYEKLYFPPGWLEMHPTKREVEEIIVALAEVLDRYPKLASTAAFALGKAHSDIAVPRLVIALERCWAADDETACQLLTALDNYGLECASNLVQRIASEGLRESREVARGLLGQTRGDD